MPIRVQRKRAKGWRMPENTLYVGRPGKWGNPFVVGEKYENGAWMACMFPVYNEFIEKYRTGIVPKSPEEAIELYKTHMATKIKTWPDAMRKELESLRGKNLACWCKIGQPCHADVLLEIANK